MVCYGKTLGGGIPNGVVCGPTSLMARGDARCPLRLAYVIGTFAAHPLLLGAMNEFLEWVITDKARKLYEQRHTEVCVVSVFVSVCVPAFVSVCVRVRTCSCRYEVVVLGWSCACELVCAFRQSPHHFLHYIVVRTRADSAVRGQNEQVPRGRRPPAQARVVRDSVDDALPVAGQVRCDASLLCLASLFFLVTHTDCSLSLSTLSDPLFSFSLLDSLTLFTLILLFFTLLTQGTTGFSSTTSRTKGLTSRGWALVALTSLSTLTSRTWTRFARGSCAQRAA